MPFWTVVRTHPNSEKIAIYNLQRQEFDYYQPKIVERKLRNHKMQQVESPLFPCYLFVHVKEQWRSLQYTYGVASLVNGVVRDHIIDGLRNRELNGIVQLPKSPPYDIGDKVKIAAGPFAGQQALVQRMPAKERQKVLLALLNNKIQVLVNEADLQAA